MEAEGPESPYLRALDSDDVRHALDEVTEYDAFKDGFLVLPTLESMYAYPGLRHRVFCQKCADRFVFAC